MHQLLNDNPLILMEGAIVEQLRHSSRVELHDSLVNAPLIYEDAGKKALATLYQDYIDVALGADLPILLCTPTWRANELRVRESECRRSVNIDAVHFMRAIRDAQGKAGATIKIGGLIGCKNDAYQPTEGLSTSTAQRFHTWQVEQLAEGGVDFLIAETLPNIHEALGIARAMEATGVPYIISFVISRDGRILDGASLTEAICFIDSQTISNPLGYMVSCAYPAFLCPEKQPSELFDRLIGYQGNGSALDHCELDGASELESEKVSDWGDLMLDMNRLYGVKVLGGCCGTSKEHMQYIASGYAAAKG